MKIEFKDFIFVKDEYSVIVDGKQILLTPLTFRLLDYFIVNKGLMITRSMLFESVWGNYSNSLSKAPDSQIMVLRKIIGAHHIVSVRGFGYKFVD